MKRIETVIAGLVIALSASCGQPAAEKAKDMEGKNDVIETIMSRRSIRKYKAEPVDKELLNIRGAVPEEP